MKDKGWPLGAERHMRLCLAVGAIKQNSIVVGLRRPHFGVRICKKRSENIVGVAFTGGKAGERIWVITQGAALIHSKIGKKP